jgi:hypothetical protein
MMFQREGAAHPDGLAHRQEGDREGSRQQGGEVGEAERGLR